MVETGQFCSVLFLLMSNVFPVISWPHFAATWFAGVAQTFGKLSVLSFQTLSQHFSFLCTPAPTHRWIVRLFWQPGTSVCVCPTLSSILSVFFRTFCCRDCFAVVKVQKRSRACRTVCKPVPYCRRCKCHTCLYSVHGWLCWCNMWLNRRALYNKS